MWTKLLFSPYLFLYLTLALPAACCIGVLIPFQPVLPILQVAVGYPVMFSLLKQGRRARAAGAMLWWAFMLGLTMVTLIVLFHETTARVIFHGPEYADEMFRWVRTGTGAESTPSLFIPQHLLHAGIFVALSLLSGGLLSLVMGSLLMNYMSFYVGSLIVGSRNTGLAILMGWHPWSIFRVAGFVILGVVLAEPLICRITGRPYQSAGARKYVLFAVVALLTDGIMKWLLAPWWGATLHRWVL